MRLLFDLVKRFVNRQRVLLIGNHLEKMQPHPRISLQKRINERFETVSKQGMGNQIDSERKKHTHKHKEKACAGKIREEDRCATPRPTHRAGIGGQG